jgi:hypothetical protein
MMGNMIMVNRKRLGVVAAAGMLAVLVSAPAAAVTVVGKGKSAPVGITFTPPATPSKPVTFNVPSNPIYTPPQVNSRGPKPAVVISSVPEPASWLTMLVGFGLLGTLTRRSPRVRGTI